MSEVKRYEAVASGLVKENYAGNLILHADYLALEARLKAASEREAIKDDALMEAVAILITIHRPEAKEVLAICEAALSPDTKGA